MNPRMRQMMLAGGALFLCALLVIASHLRHCQGVVYAPLPLPVTLHNAAHAVVVEREVLTPELRESLEQQQAGWPEGLRVSLEGMTFLYRIVYRDWDGGFEQSLSCVSAHAYEQGYASGDALVLTNSGAESETMALAFLIAGEPNAEMELPAGPQTASIGRRAGKRFFWHQREAWRGDGECLVLELGTCGSEHPLYWACHVAEGRCGFYDSRAADGAGELASRRRSFSSIGLGSMGINGSSIPQPKEAAALTPGAQELPTTHMGAACPLRVECLPLPASAPENAEAQQAGEEPRFRYIVREAELNGKRLSFTSRHRYGQAFCCGELLLLSTSGSYDEHADEQMSLIVLDIRQGRAIEDHLLPDSVRGNDFNAGASVDVDHSSVCWDGVDEEGKRCAGIYSRMIWHRADAIACNGAEMFVPLGCDATKGCPIVWEYDAGTGLTRLRNRSLLALFHSALPHRCTVLPVEVSYACGATNTESAGEPRESGTESPDAAEQAARVPQCRECS